MAKHQSKATPTSQTLFLWYKIQLNKHKKKKKKKRIQHESKREESMFFLTPQGTRSLCYLSVLQYCTSRKCRGKEVNDWAIK